MEHSSLNNQSVQNPASSKDPSPLDKSTMAAQNQMNENEAEKTGDPSTGSEPTASAVTVAHKASPKRKRRAPAVPWKKPKDMPKRPLSAYNLFFKDEREKMLASSDASADSGVPSSSATAPATTSSSPSTTPAATNTNDKKSGGGIGFANLAKQIAAKWKNLDAAQRSPYEESAAQEKAQYEAAISKWRADQKKVKAQQLQQAQQQQQQAREAATTSSATGGLMLDPSLQQGKLPAVDFFSSSHGASAADSSEADVTESYPTDWFESSMSTDHSEYNESTTGAVSGLEGIYNVGPGAAASATIITDESNRTAESTQSLRALSRNDPTAPSGLGQFPSLGRALFYDNMMSGLGTNAAAPAGGSALSYLYRYRGGNSRQQQQAFSASQQQQQMQHARHVGGMRMARSASLPGVRISEGNNDNNMGLFGGGGFLSSAVNRNCNNDDVSSSSMYAGTVANLLEPVELGYPLNSTTAAHHLQSRSVSHPFLSQETLDFLTQGHLHSSSLSQQGQQRRASGTDVYGREEMSHPTTSLLRRVSPSVVATSTRRTSTTNASTLPNVGGVGRGVSETTSMDLETAPMELEELVGYINPRPMRRQANTLNPHQEQSTGMQVDAQQKRGDNTEEKVVEASLRSLNENLDNDAIDFLTSIRYS